MSSLAIILCLLQFWGMVFTQDSKERMSFGSILQGANSALSAAAEAVDETLKRIPVVEKKVFSHCVEPPEECPNENITFWYYSRSSPDVPVKLMVSEPNSFQSLANNNAPWKIIIHGYTKSKDEIPNPELIQAYLKRGDYNLISVDYAPLAKPMCYIQAVHNVPLIAKCTAQMIDVLIDKDYFYSESLHVIGFSLGAHIAGTIHEYMRQGKPGRVTGLDPASPLFDGIINHKLTKDAGDFVDVIHTDGMVKGKLETSGHIDFYVNGGVDQPGCKVQFEETPSTCSHNRAPLYFAESINSETGFWGIPCGTYLRFYSGNCDATDSDLVLMGEFVPPTSNGVYFLETRSDPPFALGKKTRAS